MNYKKLRRYFSKKFVKTLPKDEFITRIMNMVVGTSMIEKGNLFLFDYAIKNMPPGGVVIEIGSYGGLSTNLLLYLMQKYQRDSKLINCDPWIDIFNQKQKDEGNTIMFNHNISQQQYSNYMKDSFMRASIFLNKNKLPHSFQMTSDDFFKIYNNAIETNDIFDNRVKLGAPISFAFIDGNHEYDFVKRDFKNVDKHLKLNGFILFDDSLDGTIGGAALFMKEMKVNERYRFIDKNPNYLFQKIYSN